MSGTTGPGGTEEVPGPETCTACAASGLTALPMVLNDGTEVTFVSCQRCENREWLTLGPDGVWTDIPIESVLERSARRPR